MLRFTCIALLLTIAAAAGRAQLVARGPWSGAITPYTAEVNLVLFESRLSSLEVSIHKDFVRPMTVPEQARREGDIPLLTRYRLNNLEPDTTYYYRVRAGNLRESQRTGQLRTPPLENQAASFRIAVAGGTRAASEAGGIAEIRYQQPLFFVQLGNLHNAKIAADDPTGFTDAYLSSLDSFARVELMERVPLVYTWGYFDYGKEGTLGEISAHRAFRQLTPHYPLAADADPALAGLRVDERPVAQAFTIGRVRCLVLDTQTARTRGADGETTLLGAWQNQWLRNELSAAQTSRALTLIFSSVPWHAASDADEVDSWARYPAEKEALRQWLIDAGAQRVVLVSANTGTLAAHTGGADPFIMPEFQAGNIDLPPTENPSGDWTVGPIAPEGTEEFFGLIDIEDQTHRINVTFIGMNQHSRERLRTTLSFDVPAR